jgi:hypothetical protein
MTKRDLIKEITERRARAKDSARLMAVMPRLITITNASGQFVVPIKSDEHRQELLRYVPIGLVACMEVYFKRAIQDLIDFQDKYRKRVSELGRIEFRLDSVLAIHGRTITVGEFVAHHLRISNINDIDGHLSKLLGEEFLRLMKADAKSSAAEVINLDWDDVISVVGETFRMRHVFCHEAATEPVITPEIVGRQILCAWDFVTRAEQVIGKRAGRDPGVVLSARQESLAQALLQSDKK